RRKADPAAGRFDLRKTQSLLSSFDDGQDCRNFVADGGTQLIAGLMDLGPKLRADGRDLRLLIFGQPEILKVRDRTGHAVPGAIASLVLQLRELLLLLRTKDIANFLHLVADQRTRLMARGLHLLLLFLREV